MTTNFKYQDFFTDYEKYKEQTINTDKISHSSVVSFVSGFHNKNKFTVSVLGTSIEGRSVSSIVFGNGKTKVLAWSQMHGDEPTATAALMDVLNFFAADDEHNLLRSQLLEHITFYFIPMLNPDGAERMTRENAAGIDINRDAVKLQTPEARILMSARNSFEPDFGFNLHDQNSYYTPGRANKSSAISLLAPPPDYEKSVTPVREKAMKVIVEISRVLGEIIPGHIAKYKDDHEPRSFGDNFIKAGTSSILIESGGWNNGEGKEFVRKLNFIALLSAFNSIATGAYKFADAAEYFEIPQNEELLLDLILRNLKINLDGTELTVDIGIKRDKVYSSENGSYKFESSITEVGDLSTFYGISELDLNGYSVLPGKISDTVISHPDELNPKQIDNYLRDGVTHIRMKDAGITGKFSDFPINLIREMLPKTNSIKPDSNADLVIKDGSGNIKYIVVNGFFFRLSDGPNENINGLIIH